MRILSYWATWRMNFKVFSAEETGSHGRRKSERCAIPNRRGADSAIRWTGYSGGKGHALVTDCRVPDFRWVFALSYKFLHSAGAVSQVHLECRRDHRHCCVAYKYVRHYGIDSATLQLASLTRLLPWEGMSGKGTLK